MPEQIARRITQLRASREGILARRPLAEIVAVLDAVARSLEAAVSGSAVADPWVADLHRLLDAAAAPAGIRDGILCLAASLRHEALWPLLEEELGDPRVLDEMRPRPSGGWVRAAGPGVIGCFLAGNTPLLSWPMLAAGLLAKSALFGKLSRADTQWPAVFRDAVASVDAALGECIALEVWPGGERPLDAALCEGADAVVAFGSDAAIEGLRALTPVATPFHGYGHRISIGLVLRGADVDAAAAGLARDVLLYDQEGCLSAAMLLIEGDDADAARVGDRVAAALEWQTKEWGLRPRDAAGAARVCSRRETALFGPEARIWGDAGCRWSVLLEPGTDPEPHGGECVLPLYTLPHLDALAKFLEPLRGRLQGAALASPPERLPAAAEALARAGVNRICPPGRLQMPPFSWHHNGGPVLRHLLRWTDIQGEWPGTRGVTEEDCVAS